ncbi:MAG TPA: four helix bundle protein [Victivallales bacterium]|nr:four helix bundle protein [Victivallales bacterium]
MRIKIKTYRDLLVWQKSMDLVSEIYKTTKNFPREEQYGLISQIRRCAVSIPSNIAEGYGRNSSNDYIRFLQISVGSLYELQTQIEISYNLKYLLEESFKTIYEKTKELERMLSSMIKKLKIHLKK